MMCPKYYKFTHTLDLLFCNEITESIGTVVTERRGLFQNVTGERSCTVTELATVPAEDLAKLKWWSRSSNSFLLQSY